MNVEQQIREAETKLRRCEAKAKTHNEQERCLRRYKIDVLKIKEETQPKPMLEDTDFFLLHRGGVDYKITAAELKEYLTPSAPMPWEDPQFAGRLYHVKNVQDGPLELHGYYNPYQAWDMDGNELSLNEVAEGQEVVIYAGESPDEDTSTYLFGLNGNTTWEFGRFTNTSKVENFSFIFQDAYKFNSPLTGFDTRSAKRMDNMFSSTMAFDQDISGWDTSNCTYFYGMFWGANAFNQDISGWDTSSVETGWADSMDSMFYDAFAFNQDLSNWCVKNIATQPTEFDKNATAWTKPRPNWGASC